MANYLAIVRDGTTECVVLDGDYILVSLEGTEILKISAAGAAAILARPWPRPDPRDIGISCKPGRSVSAVLAERAALREAVITATEGADA